MEFIDAKNHISSGVWGEEEALGLPSHMAGQTQMLHRQSWVCIGSHFTSVLLSGCSSQTSSLRPDLFTSHTLH